MDMKEEESVGVQLLLIHMGSVLFRFSIIKFYIAKCTSSDYRLLLHWRNLLNKKGFLVVFTLQKYSICTLFCKLCSNL